MYHELTYREIARRTRRRIAAAAACIILCAALVALAFVSASISERQAVASVKDSVNAAVMQCAAVEGSYPSSLQHLEQYYGLTINHDRYLVKYEWFADNVPPTVTVSVR